MKTTDNEPELFDVFVRAWWREAEPNDGWWLNNLVPYGGAPKTYIARDVTRAEALEICADYNGSHDAGRYSRKAEFERA